MDAWSTFAALDSWVKSAIESSYEDILIMSSAYLIEVPVPLYKPTPVGYCKTNLIYLSIYKKHFISALITFYLHAIYLFTASLNDPFFLTNTNEIGLYIRYLAAKDLERSVGLLKGYSRSVFRSCRTFKKNVRNEDRVATVVMSQRKKRSSTKAIWFSR